MSTTSQPHTSLAPTVTADDVALVKRTIAEGASDDELRLFFADCDRVGVHPLSRLLIFTKRDGRYTPITTIDLFRARAHATNKCAGIDDAVITATYGEEAFAATVTVYRIVENEPRPFTATARYSEYCPANDKAAFMWRKMPTVMIGKCAEALALRKAFPESLHGLYIAEELDQAIPTTALNTTPPPLAPAPKPAKKLPAEDRDQRARRLQIFDAAKASHVSTDELKAIMGSLFKHSDTSKLTAAETQTLLLRLHEEGINRLQDKADAEAF